MPRQVSGIRQLPVNQNHMKIFESRNGLDNPDLESLELNLTMMPPLVPARAIGSALPGIKVRTFSLHSHSRPNLYSWQRAASRSVIGVQLWSGVGSAMRSFLESTSLPLCYAGRFDRWTRPMWKEWNGHNSESKSFQCLTKRPDISS